MPNVTVTLTSASTNTTTPIALNWIGAKPTTASVIAASVSSGAFIIQYTLDDLQRVSSALVAWSGVSSATGTAGTIFNASNAYPDGVTVTFLNPIAGLRLISSAALTNGPLTFRVLQGEGG